MNAIVQMAIHVCFHSFIKANHIMLALSSIITNIGVELHMIQMVKLFIGESAIQIVPLEVFFVFDIEIIINQIQYYYRTT